MPAVNRTQIAETGRSAGTRAVPSTFGTRVSVLTQKDDRPSSMYISKCPSCRAPRRHTKPGLRRCGCGAVYRVVVGSVVGAFPESTENCQQATVSAESVSAADSSTARESNALTCSSDGNPARSTLAGTVSADNCSAPPKDRSR